MRMRLHAGLGPCVRVRPPLRHAAAMLLVWLACWAGPALAQAWPAIHWPAVLVPDKKVSAYWVAERLVQNGVPMQIKGIDLSGSTEREVTFYRDWLQTKRDFVETRLNGNLVMAARDGDFRIVAEFKPSKEAGKTQVRFTTAWVYGKVPDIVGPQLAQDLALTMPLGTDQLSDTFSFDADLVNRTTVYGNSLSVEANELYIREQALLRGWTVVGRSTLKGGLRIQTVLRRNKQEAIVATTRNGQFCSIVISNTLQP